MTTVKTNLPVYTLMQMGEIKITMNKGGLEAGKPLDLTHPTFRKKILTEREVVILETDDDNPEQVCVGLNFPNQYKDFSTQSVYEPGDLFIVDTKLNMYHIEECKEDYYPFTHIPDLNKYFILDPNYKVGSSTRNHALLTAYAEDNPQEFLSIQNEDRKFCDPNHVYVNKRHAGKHIFGVYRDNFGTLRIMTNRAKETHVP